MNTFTLLLDWLLAASARASVLTLVVFIAQALLRHRVPARWRYALWLPVLTVLIMPAFPESAWSVASVIKVAAAPLPEPAFMKEQTAFLSPAATAAVPALPAPVPWAEVLGFVWLAGAVGMVLAGMGGFARTLWQFQRSRLVVSDAVLRELAALARETGLPRAPRVWMSSAIRGPAVTGLLRPTLLLPAHFDETLTANEARLVLKHELTHIKRSDLPLNALLCLLLALHWFNPLLWLAFFKVRLDREAACDAQVLDNESQAQRVAYGHTLLKVETAFSRQGLSLGFVGIFQRGSALRSRIQSLASRPTQHPLMKAALSLGILLLTFLGITRAATPDPKAPQIHIAAKFVEVSTGPAGAVRLPAPLDGTKKVPGLAGTLADRQFQTLIRTLSQRKGVDLCSAPSLTTRSGQRATVEVVREFPYKDKAGKALTKSTGISLDLLPQVRADGRIDLSLTPQVVEFNGFIHHKDSWEEPIFSERKLPLSATMTSEQTLVLEMTPRTDKQIVEDTDETGHTITRTDSFIRRMLVFVTATKVDPATGKPLTSSSVSARQANAGRR